MHTSLRHTLPIALVAIVLATATSVFAAWTGPTASPPGDNTAAPVNVGATAQVKSGDFWAASVGSDNGFCIGVDCITEWAEVSGAWTTNGSNVYYSGGNVGVGTTSPGLPLSVVGAAYVTGNVTASGFFHNSDERLKTNITTISSPLNILKNIRGVSFNWKDATTPSHGVLAQEVEQVLPAAVQDGPHGYKTVEYDQLIGVLIEAIKEQQQQIDTLEYEVAAFKALH